ncbi:hypothetical protein [Halocynthiibacter namhaensis]|uniref:hypothetical protein n=1 Tax=Halocynthiibacter namhaensis TaxID=1290553 RepID=UPI0012E07624|nr:hypothetical protein [Halocynthiibacter namhaensis]
MSLRTILLLVGVLLPSTTIAQSTSPTQDCYEVPNSFELCENDNVSVQGLWEPNRLGISVRGNQGQRHGIGVRFSDPDWCILWWICRNSDHEVYVANRLQESKNEMLVHGNEDSLHIVHKGTLQLPGYTGNVTRFRLYDLRTMSFSTRIGNRTVTFEASKINSENDASFAVMERRISMVLTQIQ